MILYANELCNQLLYRRVRSLYINYVYIFLLSRNIIEKKSGHVGTRTCVASLSQQTCYASSIPSCISKKKDTSSPELSNTVFSHSSIVNSHVMTDVFLLCNQYYCAVVYILIIYIYIYKIFIRPINIGRM